MQVKIDWMGEQSFIGYDQNALSLGISPNLEDKDKFSPPALLLMSLGSCTGLFIIPSAKSLGVKLKDFDIHLKGIKANKPPKLFYKIVEEINLVEDFEVTLAHKIINEAHKRCFILKSINPNIIVENIIRVNGQLI